MYPTNSGTWSQIQNGWTQVVVVGPDSDRQATPFMAKKHPHKALTTAVPQTFLGKQVRSSYFLVTGIFPKP